MPGGDQVQIYLLDGFAVQRGQARVEPEDWKRRKAAALLQRVSVEGKLLKDQAIEFLWPNLAPAAGANNLYRTLHSLRRTLDRELGEGASDATIVFRHGVVSLADGVWVDAQAFEAAARGKDRDDLERALKLYEGPLLPNARYDEWTLPHRDAYQQAYREASLRLAEAHASGGEPARAIDLLSPLLKHDPADEVAHRELMRSYARVGRRHDALRQYQECVEQLRQELGVDPAPATRDLYESILAGTFPPQKETGEGARWSPPAATEVGAAGKPLVGRAEELALLEEALEAAEDGQGSTWLIEGFPGIGKSRLAQEILGRADRRGFKVLSGAAHEEEGQLPYHPFVEAFDRAVAHAEGLSSHPLSNVKLKPEGEGVKDALALYRSVVSFLAHQEHGRPFVMLVDDLHEADEGSLQLFHYLARQTPNLRGMLLATFRSGEAGQATTFDTVLNSLYRERFGGRLELEPLSREGVAEILRHELGKSPAEELVRSVHDICEGNPFFAQEVVRAARAKGLLVEGEETVSLGGEVLRQHIPKELMALLKGRVSELGPEMEEVLTAAAVLGREFRFELLQGMVDLPDAQLLDALDLALESDHVQETESGYRFRHGLIRQALYKSLSRIRRQRLHRVAAEALQPAASERDEAVLARVEALAHHHARSDQPHLAIDYLVQAGEKAARMYAFEVAVEHFERALELMDELKVDDAQKRFDLLASIEGYHGLLADTPKAVEAGNRALEIRGEDWAPSPEQRAFIRRRSAIHLITAGRLQEAESTLEAALEHLEGRAESTEYSRVLYNLAQLRWHQNRYQEAYQIAERSLAIAERLDDRDSVARAFEMLALACHSLGKWQQGIAYEEQREAVSGSALDVDSAFDVHL